MTTPKEAHSCPAKKTVGKVTPEERDEIKRLFERKDALRELFHSLSDMPKEELEGRALYDKIVDDVAKTNAAFSAWWTDMSKKYKWAGQGAAWHIDFDSCEIYQKGPHPAHSEGVRPVTDISC